MAHVDYIAPVEAVHGKLSKEDRYGFAKRTKRNGAGNRIAYTFKSPTRTKTATAAELARQAKFAAVVKSTRARLQDPTKMGADQMAFAAQTKYKSLYSYVFNQEWNA